MTTSASGLHSDSPVAFALLAAGRGERFGEGKLHADLAGKPLWRWAIDSAIAAGLTDIHVVTNDPEIARTCRDNGWSAHPNPAAATGMGSSLRIATSATPKGTRRIIALADMPFVEPEHLRRLAMADGTAFTRHPDGRLGVPAGFPDTEAERLATIRGDRGAMSLEWPDALAFDPPSPETLLDIDTPEILVRAREIAIRRCRANDR